MESNSMSPSQNISKHKSKKQKTPKKGTVYDRIYKQLKKNNSSGLLQSTSEMSKSSNFNYGEYLYARGLKKKEEQKKTAESIQQARNDSELPELTFKPSINKLSNLASPKSSDKPEEVLLKKAKEYQEKLDKLKEEKEEKEMKECKFTPKINNISKNRENSKNIHDELFVQAEKKREKLLKKVEEETLQYSFKPSINQTKKKPAKESKEEFFDRLDSTKKLLEEELDRKRRKKEEIDVDEVTGQKLFKPLINSSSEKVFTNQRLTETSIWEFLYSRKDTKKRELEELKTEQQRMLEAASVSKKSCEGSDKIFQEFRLRQYERLFNSLDSDNDGKISANAIKIDEIDVKALEILTPFFEELAGSQETLDFQQFCGKIDLLYKSLNVAQRSQLLRKETKSENVEPERRPFISQNSVALAEKKRSTLPQDMYDRLTAANKMTEMRMLKIKEDKEKEFTKECTFKPLLKSN